jgi:hypothetical protein
MGSSSASTEEAAGVKVFSTGVPVSSVEAVETRLTTAEVAASPAPTDFSSRASFFSSSESLRMMTVSSLGDPRRSQLSSP